MLPSQFHAARVKYRPSPLMHVITLRWAQRNGPTPRGPSYMGIKEPDIYKIVAKISDHYQCRAAVKETKRSVSFVVIWLLSSTGRPRGVLNYVAMAEGEKSGP